ncbi:hypothetical protein ACFLXU_01190 [Chloroflexota bacterium]
MSKMSKKQMSNTEFHYLIQYLEQALNWQLWVKSADDLLAAAGELEPSIKTYWTISKENLEAEQEDVREGRDRRPWKEAGPYLQAIYSMLVAYAIENLYKTILILQNKNQYKQDIIRERGLPRELKTQKHNLLDLVNKLKLNINEDEKNILLRLSRNSYWQGRYPVPTKAKDLNSVVVSDGIPHFVAFLSPNDFPKIKSLISRIKEHIKDNIQKC